jgi:pyrimidine operon attenuation protein/uracil phosphoribosyltransferase
MNNGTRFDVDKLLDKVANKTAALIKDEGLSDPLLVGIKTGGVWVANEIKQRLNMTSTLAELNINFYRDDFSRIGIHPNVAPSELLVEIDGRNLILVDDILFTGRTVRAAMNEIFDYGRPRTIYLVVLLDRGGRELPIAASVTGTTISLKRGEHVKLEGPTSLQLKFCGR